MKTLIKNGTIVTAYNEYKANILLDGETIVAIGRDMAFSADNVIDATGKYILPGGVDQHTHFSALCNSGDRDTAGYETTDTVIRGGTTTIIDYAPQEPGQGLIDSARYRIDVRAKGKTCVDFSLHSLVTEVSDSLFEEIACLPENGISTLKLFMAYKGSPLYVDDGTLYKAMLKCKEVGVTVFVHAENGEIIDQLQRDCIKEGKTAPEFHAVSRPPFVEGEATRRAIYIAKNAGSPLYIVHMTCREAVEAVVEARGLGQQVMGETCTHYLIATTDKLKNPDFNQSARYVCSPALRSKEEVEYLWHAIKSGKLNAIVSDHCGIDIAELKQEGRNDFTKIPNGSPGAADRLNMIWAHGVCTGRISRQKFVELISTNPAKINGLFPRKGHIDVGCDADIVIFDPDYRGIVRHADNPNGVDYNIYEGEPMMGRPETVFLRGKLTVENGVFVGEYGQGQFIECKAYASGFTGL